MLLSDTNEQDMQRLAAACAYLQVLCLCVRGVVRGKELCPVPVHSHELVFRQRTDISEWQYLMTAEGF